MRCGVLFGPHNVSYLSVMSAGHVLEGCGRWKQKFGDISAQNYELFGYFDCSSSMISSNVGDSEKPGRGAFAG